MNISQKISEEKKVLKEKRQNLRNLRKEKSLLERRIKFLKSKLEKVGEVKPPGRRLKELERKYKSLYFKYQTGQTPMSREKEIVARLDEMEAELEKLRTMKKNFFKSRHWKEELQAAENRLAELSKQMKELHKEIEAHEKKLEKLLEKVPKEAKKGESKIITVGYSKEMPAEEVSELADKIMKKFLAGEKITAEELAILQKAEEGKKND